MPDRGPGCPRTRSARQVRKRRERGDQHVVSLPGVTAATQSSAPRRASRARGRPASTPGSATCTRSAGSEYRSSSRRRVHALVVTTAAAADSTARSRAGDVVRPRAVAERHVHQDDQPQPARLRHQHLRGRRGDQPVQQHDGAVGDRRRPRRPAPRAPPRRAAARRRARRARAPTSRSRRARRRPGGRRCCRRWAAPGRRCRRAPRRARRVTAPARSSPRRRATRAG